MPKQRRLPTGGGATPASPAAVADAPQSRRHAGPKAASARVPLSLFLLHPAPAPDAAPDAPPTGQRLSLRTHGLHTGAAEADPLPWTLKAAAMKWSELLRNRARWAGNSHFESELRADARRLLLDLLGHDGDTGGAVAMAALKVVADAEMIEVQIPYEHEETNWEYRIFPWEFILAEATRDQRAGGRLMVVRHLRDGRTITTGGTLLLHVESVPGPLRGAYDFSGERLLLQAVANDDLLKYTPLIDVDAQALAAATASMRTDQPANAPRVVHVSGFDAPQAMDLLGHDRNAAPTAHARAGTTTDAVAGAPPPDPPRRPRDGLVMRAHTGAAWEVIGAQQLARCLTGPNLHPSLVCINTYNSAARMAAMCVAEGAGAAIGFQDTFDDDLAELFFSALYRGCLAAGWDDLAGAFRYAWSVVSDQGRPLLGAGVVLWSRQSISAQRPLAVAEIRRRIEQGVIASVGQTQFAAIAPAAAPASAAAIAASLDVTVEPLRELNYSILHNEGALFDHFTIRKTNLSVGRIDGIEIHVELYAGNDRFPFRTRIAIDAHTPTRELAQDIKVPLTSSLGRAQRENIRTSLYVEVTLNAGQETFTLHRQTYRVTLLSVDEWRDDEANRIWLPSFVQPRDPAVLRVVESAQRYLMALRDDPGAGFDGYQCVEYTTARPDPVTDCVLVDRQVQALWAALLYEHPLSYINPPPTFSEASQRLRTPSDVIDGRRGTCIDLALLLASCLEYIDIHAGIVLLKAHAFPVYWRHDSYLEDFCVGVAPVDTDDPERRARGKAKAPWSIGASEYRTIKREIDLGRLVPIETVMLTQRVGFAEAVDEGLSNFRTRRDFDSLLDIQIARADRARSVTPLPLRREERG